ncbi:IclR family transcriptional regulator [Pararobbsia alpina]|uniref:HTH-type transcriptional repressor AllR n=1 Tax=Pararobbsia alpina TaxID=621374 RepID=A0A6S7BEN6_9BURK|nr:IclR family transcriptional regulator [Pararobbsia alpina]CAB3797862.1 HTH-type transcriptional repressor AllR [Pararobbsia alpina]
MLTTKKPASVSGAQTIHRAIRALKLVAAQPERGLRLVDVAEKMGLERPTAHRLLKALTEERMLVQHPGSRRYSLGALLFELGLAAAHQYNLHEVCQPVLQKLADETGDSSFLFVRSGNDVVCLARQEGSHPIQTPVVPVGARQPLGVNAGGLALLTALPEQEVMKIIEAIEPRLDAYSNLEVDRLHDYWERARTLGYALIGEHAVPGITAVGLPVINAAGLPIAAITVASIHERMSNARIPTLIPMLKKASEMLTQLLRQ